MLFTFVSQTHKLKIILIMEKKWVMDNHEIDPVVLNQEVGYLDKGRNSAARLMYQLCQR